MRVTIDQGISGWILLIVIECLILSIVLTAEPNTHHPQSSLFSWSNITVTLRGQRNILKLGPGNVYRGRVLGVLGPSGSGKSTFLNLLANRLEKSNGLRYHSDLKVSKDASLSSNIDEKESSRHAEGDLLSGDEVAFVYQHDLFFSRLSVVETAQFAIIMRKLGNFDSKLLNQNENALSNVTDVLEALGLLHISNSYVGNPEDPAVRGISGGERKRLSVACEIIGHPVLLIADEPTSGLDAYQAQQVVNRLSDLASTKSLAVVMTLHQPRTSIWQRLDDILLIAPGGGEVYHGPRDRALSYFASHSFHCPPNTNPAEFLIDLVSFNTTDASSYEESVERINRLVELFAKFNKPNMKQPPASVNFPVQDPSKRSNFSSEKPKLLRKLFGAISGLGTGAINRLGKSVARFVVLLDRSWKQTVRNWQSAAVQLAVSGILAFALSAVYGRLPTEFTEASVANRVIILSNGVINICLLSMLRTLQLFKIERPVVSRERLEGLYAAHEYLLGNVLAEIPIGVCVASFFGYALHTSTNLSCDRSLFMAILSLLSVATSTMGLAISSLFQKGDAALSIGPGMMIIFLITGAIGPSGVGKALPRYLTPLRTLSPIKWGCEAIAAAEFRDKDFVLPPIQKTIIPTNRGPLTLIMRPIRALTTKISDAVKFAQLVHQASRDPSLRTPKPGGNRALEALGVGDATIESSTKAMLRMVLGNLIITWLGLVFLKPK